MEKANAEELLKQIEPDKIAPAVEMYCENGSELSPGKRQLVKYESIYAMCGLLVATVCIILGVLLSINNIDGKTEWAAKIFGAESHVSGAAPGAILFIVGFLIIIFTKFNVKINK